MMLAMTTTLPPRHVHVEHVMGTVVSLDIRGARTTLAHRAASELAAWLHDVDRRFNADRDDSEIARIARGELAIGDAGPDVRWVLDRCAQLRRATGGAFDEYATGALDPSAFVRGWALQRGAELLRREGLTDFALLTADGDIVVRGGALPDQAWRVGIQHPDDRGVIALAIAVRDMSTPATRSC
jgi:thiamine biosynthesis lipoprotein